MCPTNNKWALTGALIFFGAFFFAIRGLPGVEPAASITGELVAKITPAFVFIAGGSGALISADGELLTNYHVIENLRGKEIGVALGDGRIFNAAIMGVDRQGDLALLKINGAADLPFLPLGVSENLAVGDFCLAAGNPLALGMIDQTPAFSAGVISALHQFRQGYNDAIVIDAAVNPGNSGGPLVNDRGELIGICGMTQTRLGLRSNTGVAFAIPIDQVKLWLSFLRQANGGNVFHGRLAGLVLRENNGEVIVEKSSPTWSLQAGDVLVELENYRIPTLARFASVQGIFPAGAALSLTVRRGIGEQMENKKIDFQLPPLRNWRPAFNLAMPADGDLYPKILTVVPNSAAALAKITAGDEIIAINELPVNIDGIGQLQDYLNGLCSGDEINLELRRDGSQFSARFIAE